MATQSLVHLAGESVLYTMEFGSLLSRGETIAGVTSVVSDDNSLTVSHTAYSGTRLQFRCDGGTVGIKYKITATIQTSSSDVRIGIGYLQVE